MHNNDGKTVLMIEDDHGVRTILTLFLEKAGFRVLEAASAGEARYVWHEQLGMVDVVVCDVVLPDADGSDLVAEFREERPEIKIVMMSGGVPAPLGGITQESRRPFLPKPFAPRILIDVINN
jgi:DNA-binding NtrC family response regulator